ncbi:aminotransferase class IV [Clostridium sp. JNZ J1-5]|nr:aminotransferase class IV [Clostridium sp.]
MSECYSERFICNGNVMECNEFKDSFLHKGKSLYEVIRIVEGVPLFLEDHLKRLFNSAKVTGLNLWLEESHIKNSIKELCKINSTYFGNVKLIFNFNEDGNNNFLVYFIKHKYPSEDMYLNGVSTVLYKAERENPNAKIINMNLRETTNKIIEDKGVYEVILVDRNGYITEGSRSNIFMIKGEKVYTSPVEDVLPGITRAYIIKACNNLGYEVIEKRVNCNEVNELDGLFISGTSPKVLPISKVDNINFDPKNSVVQNIKYGYDKIIEEYIENSRY